MRPTPTWFRLLVHLFAALPLIILISQALTDNLTANPIQAVTQRTGQAAIIGLLLTLSGTPLHTLTGWTWGLGMRRALGLWAGFYALLHFLTFTLLDYALDWKQIGRAVVEKPFILVGLIALGTLVPLSLTSTRSAMRRMGAAWKRLHRLTYLAAGAAVGHYLLAAKADFAPQPLVYGGILGLLMVLRIPQIKRGLVRLRLKLQARPETPVRD
ncbi:MAG TPA: protein-methionine-sulfoxide reductase heme-binding subunit MsrQ [Anaerolineaceae bacterium]|jgi:sulfoxide reductase heme-binding subunit YedZ|nr:protein-methionine-sulfoxide reductase heme-binding subunit MsrQ [Anaerolineaceae bacterium]